MSTYQNTRDDGARGALLCFLFIGTAIRNHVLPDSRTREGRKAVDLGIVWWALTSPVALNDEARNEVEDAMCIGDCFVEVRF